MANWRISLFVCASLVATAHATPATAPRTVRVDRDGTQVTRAEGATDEASSLLEMAETLAHAGDLVRDEPVPDELRAERIFGIWKRTQITNTLAYPFRTVGLLDHGCTATLIGPRHALTAGHCVFNTDEKRWISQLDFSPGQSGANKAFGTFRWKNVLSTEGWTRDAKVEWDFALVLYEEAPGDRVGWMSYGYKDGLGTGATININGYPADQPAGTLWHVDCPLENGSNAEKLYYRCDTFGGNSGSALYWYDGTSKRVIYGVHHGGDVSSNFGARINQTKFNRINQWISENP